MNIGILSANVLLADMAVCIRLQIERKGFESSAGLCKKCLNEDLERLIGLTGLKANHFNPPKSSFRQTKKVLWQNGYMHRSEIPDIVVQFHGAPHLIKLKTVQLKIMFTRVIN